ncbi:hypothetical protein GCM10007989_03290 [Devosia pacifica]|uniref:Polysaccharide chain length determinant N-terminal domain-containing protein n=2 Tax=Devosia pacifica TaxID=1335967 RepID=A0A918RV08_9HYPH|nr:hypothetical protein GCM10007989_03290 [Devosia pacifica]
MLFDYAPATLFDIRAVWNRLWRHRLLILLITLGAIALSIAYVATAKPNYVATASILVDPRDINSTDIESVLPGIGTDSAAITSQVSIIASRDLLLDVYRQLELDSDPDFAAGSGMLSRLLGTPQGSRDEISFEKFRKTVSVSREGLTYVINVSVKLGDPDKAALIANTVVENYIARTQAQMTSAVDAVNAELDSKIVELQNEVADAELAVERFKADNSIFDSSTGGTLQSQIDLSAGQLATAQDELAQLQARYEQAVAAGTSPGELAMTSDISASPEIGRMRDQYNLAAAALANVSSTFGSRHPSVVQAQAELDSISSLLTSEAERFTRQLASDRDAVQGKVDRLQSRIEELRQSGAASSVAQIELRQLQARADATRTVLADFMQRSKETSQIANMQSSRVEIISGAVAPPQPVWPKPSLMLPVAAVLGFLAGCGIALVLADSRTQNAPAPSPKPRKSASPSTEKTPGRKPSLVPQAQIRREPHPASLAAARSEIFSANDTPLVASVQTLVRDVIGRLPEHSRPFVVAFTGANSASAMRVAALGFARIGAEVHIHGNANSSRQSAQHDFIFVQDGDAHIHPVDVTVEALAQGEVRRNPADIAFTPPAARPALVLAAG